MLRVGPGGGGFPGGEACERRCSVSESEPAAAAAHSRAFVCVRRPLLRPYGLQAGGPAAGPVMVPAAPGGPAPRLRLLTELELESRPSHAASLSAATAASVTVPVCRRRHSSCNGVCESESGSLTQSDSELRAGETVRLRARPGARGVLGNLTRKSP
jgi:hypothetical protein